MFNPFEYHPAREAARIEAQIRRHQLDARAARAWEKYGDAFAGLDARGNVVLWRKSPIPAVPRKVRT